MLFNSYIFWIFFFAVFTVYWIVPRKYQNSILLISSYIFYGAWDWRFLSLIFISTVVDFSVAKKIEKKSRHKKFYLFISIVTNLGILGTFKYLGFFVEQFNILLLMLGLEAFLPTVSIILPVGISFYTFQTLSYTIDVYRKDTLPVHNLLDFALYVSFFPQLVAGPIERSHRLLPQITHSRTFKEIKFEEGFYYVIYGLFLKIVVADNMAIIANSIYTVQPNTLTGIDVIAGTYAFAFQIYGDFAGYSFIAIGIAKWLGINLMANFNSPYLAHTPSDFWKRWHISLSTWLRDYLYIPLGGNKGGTWLTVRNLFITMILGGLWHGAGWTFIAWGAFHSFLLILYKLIKEWHLWKRFTNYPLFSKVISMVVLFHLMCISWMFFRAESLDQVGGLFNQLIFNFTSSSHTAGIMGIIIFYVGPIFLYELWNEKKNFKLFNDRPTLSLILFFNYCFLMILIFPAPTHQEFIYFQF